MESRCLGEGVGGVWEFDNECATVLVYGWNITLGQESSRAERKDSKRGPPETELVKKYIQNEITSFREGQSSEKPDYASSAKFR